MQNSCNVDDVVVQMKLLHILFFSYQIEIYLFLLIIKRLTYITVIFRYKSMGGFVKHSLLTKST